jgi:hypothetical protein
MIKGEWARLKNVIGPSSLTSVSGQLFNPFQELIEPARRSRRQLVPHPGQEANLLRYFSIPPLT